MPSWSDTSRAFCIRHSVLEAETYRCADAIRNGRARVRIGSFDKSSTIVHPTNHHLTSKVVDSSGR